MNELKTTIENIKDEFLNRKYILKKHSQLYFGDLGKIIYLSNFIQYSKDESIQKELWRLIEEAVLQAEYSMKSDYLSDGLCGLAWLLKWLENCEIIEKQDELLVTIDAKLKKRAFECENYDLMYGLIGYGVYFLESKDVKTTKTITEKLLKLATKTNYGKIWFDNLSTYDVSNLKYDKSAKAINTGLAHGIPSIISYLSSAYNLNPSFDLSTTVHDIIKVLKELTVIGGNCTFSNLYDEDFKPVKSYDYSKIAWTYGDVAMGFSLVKAGYILNDKNIIDYGMEILNKTINRGLEGSGIYQKEIISAIDTSFCNGTSGVAHMYGRLYQLTKNTEFLKRLEYWILKTLNGSLKDKRRGIYGYVSYKFDEDYFLTIKEIDTTLFSGVSGASLILLEYYFGDKYTKNISNGWDKIFLTNIN